MRNLPKPQGFIAHGGGPTSVLNASLQGTVEEGHRRFRRLWAPHGGLAGLLRGEVLDLLEVPLRRVERLADQPGSMIGSFRGEVTDEHVESILDFFRHHDIRHFFLCRRQRLDGYRLEDCPCGHGSGL